jgi:hypothetical protein
MKGNSRKYFFITILALYLCTDSRVMAQKWEKIGSEFNNIGKLVYVNGTQLFVIIEDKRYSQNPWYDSLIISTDNGSTWSKSNFLDSTILNDRHWVQKGNILYGAGLAVDSMACIFQSFDYGLTWGIFYTFPSKDHIWGLFLESDSIISCNDGPDLLFSIDKGKSWIVIPFLDNVTFDYRDGIYIIAYPAHYGVSVSSDFGTWTTIPAINVYSYVSPFIFGDRSFVGDSYRTKDDTSWKTMSGLSTTSPFYLSFENGILYATYDIFSKTEESRFLYFSLDSGANWQLLGDSIINLGNYSGNFFIGSEYYFLTAQNELWRLPKSAVNLQSVSQKNTSSLSLACFPNPATSTTRISYSIPQHSLVVIEAFDIMGRAVARIASGARDAGSYESVWDTNLLPAGSYIIRLTSGGESVSKAVEVVK